MHEKDNIILVGYTSIDGGIRTIIIPPHRAIEVLQKTFASHLREHNCAQEHFKRAQREAKNAL